MSKRLILIVAVSVIFLSSAGIVTFLSAQEGNDPHAKGQRVDSASLPLETRFAPDRIYRGGGATVWRVSRDLGVLLSADAGATWTARNQGLPFRAVYPFLAPKPPIVTCLAVDPSNDKRVGITTLDTLYLSSDAGVTWEKIELKDPLRANDQLTCLALSPYSEKAFAIGTSFHGFFETTDRGKTWISLSEPLTPLKLGGGNYEEIASLAYDPQQPDLIWFNLGFGKGLFAYRKGGKSVDRLDLPSGPYASPVRDISFQRNSAPEGWTLQARTDTARWEYSGGSACGRWSRGSRRTSRCRPTRRTGSPRRRASSASMSPRSGEAGRASRGTSTFSRPRA